MNTSSLFLVLNDGSTFSLEKKYISQIKLLADMVADLGEIEAPVPIGCEDVTAETLQLMIQYLEQYPNEPEDAKYYILDEWSTEFFSPLNYQTMERLIKCANYFAVTSLVERCAVKIATMMRGKTIAELGDLFGRELAPEFVEELKSEDWNFV